MLPSEPRPSGSVLCFHPSRDRQAASYASSEPRPNSRQSRVCAATWLVRAIVLKRSELEFCSPASTPPWELGAARPYLLIAAVALSAGCEHYCSSATESVYVLRFCSHLRSTSFRFQAPLGGVVDFQRKGLLRHLNCNFGAAIERACSLAPGRFIKCY
jgi:hypothetical protein